MSPTSDFTFFLNSFAGLFSVMDPIGAIPLFLAMAGTQSREDLRRTVRTAMITVVVAMLIFAVFGQHFLAFFGISLPAFKASGGLLILLMGISMLNAEPRRAKNTPEETTEAMERQSVAIVPLAIPLLVGPGTISTIVLLSERATTVQRELLFYTAMGLVCLVAFVCLSLSEVLRRVLRETGIRVATRIMGLITAALAMQFIADGFLELFPGLAGIAG